jgi:hypothetical protein
VPRRQLLHFFEEALETGGMFPWGEPAPDGELPP